MEKIRKWANKLYVKFQESYVVLELTPTNNKIDYETLIKNVDKQVIADHLKCDINDVVFITKDEYNEIANRDDYVACDISGECTDIKLYIKYNDKASIINLGKAEANIEYSVLVDKVDKNKIAAILDCNVEDLIFLTEEEYKDLTSNEKYIPIK